MKVATTGPRNYRGTWKQVETFLAYLKTLELSEWHHGDCVGWDEQSHNIIRTWFKNTPIHIHPPIDPKLRAFCSGDIMYPPHSYHARNQEMVDSVDLLIGVPKSMTPSDYGGTWYTIRHAWAVGKPTMIFYPDGRVSDARGG